MYLKPMLGSTGSEGMKLVLYANPVSFDLVNKEKVNTEMM